MQTHRNAILRLEGLLELRVSAQDPILLNQPTHFTNPTSLNVPGGWGLLKLGTTAGFLKKVFLKFFFLIFVLTLHPRAFPAWLWCCTTSDKSNISECGQMRHYQTSVITRQ